MLLLIMRCYPIFLIACLLLFAGCNDDEKTYYEVVEDKVIYHYVRRDGINWYRATYHQKTVKEADAATFESLSSEYGKDKQFVFSKGKKLSRDPESFRLLSRSITADKNAAYYNDKKIKKSDGPSFEVLDTDYCVDKRSVFARTYEKFVALNKADRESFRVLRNGYAEDKHKLYYEGFALERIDVKNYHLLVNFYAMDSSFVYWKQHLLPDADAGSFVVLSHGYAKDDKQVFYNESKLNADPASFVVWKEPQKGSESMPSYWAEDENYYYNGLTATKKP